MRDMLKVKPLVRNRYGEEGAGIAGYEAVREGLGLVDPGTKQTDNIRIRSHS